MVTVNEEFKNGAWTCKSSVPAVQKLISYNRDVRGVSSEEDMSVANEKEELSAATTALTEPAKLATTTFMAPSVIALGRRDNITAPSAFITGFWVCPVGTGKSRFMSAAIGKTPFSFPRWLVHMNLNNFLDQDTFLLCGQNRAVLKREAEGYLDSDDNKSATNDVRKSTYVYRSPSEKMPVRIGQFFDATLEKAPNRKEGVLNWYDKNVNNHRLLEPWPSREVVLDRFGQHTKICPDSMDVVRRCDKVIKSSKTVALALLFMKLVLSQSSVAVSSSVQQQLSISNPFMLGSSILSASRQLLSQLVSFGCNLATRNASSLVQNKTFYTILALAYLFHSIASRIRREFFFKWDEKLHQEDIKAIAKGWKDL